MSQGKGTAIGAALQSVPTGVRSAVLASPDPAFRSRVHHALAGLRWQIREASGGAEALAFLDNAPAETVVLDSWLPDLEIREFVSEFRRLHPDTDLVTVDPSLCPGSSARSPRRNEVLHAMRCADEPGDTIGNRIPSPVSVALPHSSPGQKEIPDSVTQSASESTIPIPELIGTHPAMLEATRRIRLVAPRSTPVLIQGPTGSGKEVVARALHNLSPRTPAKFLAINCAAIPEALLEAELFGHARGAFTGADRSRTGRIEAANGGTLLLDEIGEMPLALQAKLLRFLETGEIQRVGDNEPVRVDVRVLAATHRPLAKLAAKGVFRQDLYYRLAVFLIRTPALAGRNEDIEALCLHFLGNLAHGSSRKSLTSRAMTRLLAHSWPGNVRELAHVLERAWILAGDRHLIDEEEIEFDEPVMS